MALLRVCIRLASAAFLPGWLSTAGGAEAAATTTRNVAPAFWPTVWTMPMASWPSGALLKEGSARPRDCGRTERGGQTPAG